MFCLNRTRTMVWRGIGTVLWLLLLWTSVSAEIQTITGRVVEDDNHDHPVSGARLWWQIANGFPESQLVEGTSDADGRFTLTSDQPIPDVLQNCYTLWVLKDGKRLTSQYARQPQGSGAPELLIPLERAAQTSFVIHSPDHKPLAGVRVEPWHFRTHQGYGIVPAPIRELLTVTSDSDGEVLMPQLAYTAFHSLNVISPEWGTQKFRLDGPATLPVSRRVLTLSSVGRIEGRLHSRDSELVANVRLHLTTGNEDWTDSGWAPEGSATVMSDQNGRFEVPAIATGPLAIDMNVEPDALELPRMTASQSQVVASGQTLSVRIDYETSIPVRGIIRSQKEKTPIPGATISVRYGTGRQGVMVKSNAEGQFEARVLSGKVFTQVIATPVEFQMYQETESIGAWPIRIPAGRVEPVELSPIELIRLIELKGKLVDQNGDPVSRTKLNGVHSQLRYGFGKSSEEGQFTLLVPDTITVKKFEIWLEDGVKRVEPTRVEFDPLVIHVQVPDVVPSTP